MNRCRFLPVLAGGVITPKFVYVNPANPRQQVITTQLGLNVPAGYLLSNTSDGSAQFVDGLTDKDMQIYVGGVNSGGFPAYAGDPQTSGNKNPNGIINWQ